MDPVAIIIMLVIGAVAGWLAGLIYTGEERSARSATIFSPSGVSFGTSPGSRLRRFL